MKPSINRLFFFLGFCFLSAALFYPFVSRAQAQDSGWQDMYDGKSMDGWTVPALGGEGEVGVYETDDGETVLELPMGNDVTMVEYQKEFPKCDYELEFVSRRSMGTDLFSCCIFPIGNRMSSIVFGGWGGSVAGLSVIDGQDANNNETKVNIPTFNNKWYTTRIAVTAERVIASVDGKEFVNFTIGKRELGLRNDTGQRKKVAFLSWQSTGELKSVRFRKIPAAGEDKTAQSAPVAEKLNVQKLFDGETLNNWKPVTLYDFMHAGKISVKEGAIHLEQGAPATGIQFQGEFPKMGYELSYDARRLEGGDFFGTAILPVDDRFIGFVLGGWGGSLCGFSCIDGFSADENESTIVREFKTGEWYRIRIRVVPDTITVWINGEEATKLDIKDRKVSNRLEMEPVEPMGFSTWYTTSELKNITVEKLITF